MKYTDAQLKQWKDEINAALILRSRIKLAKEGAEYTGLCPFHEEKTGSFKIYKKDGWWQCHCHGACGKTWNVFQVIQHTDNLSFEAAVDKVLLEAKWEEGKEVVDSVFVPAMDAEKKFVTYPLSRLEAAEKALPGSVGERWLENRGITLETAKTLHIGFIGDLRAINPNHPWVAEGWLAIPTIQDDQITCLKYRSVKGKKTEQGKSGILRAPNMATSLYNLQMVTPLDDCFLCEGEPDVAVLTQAGYAACGLPSAEYVPTPAERDVLVRANRIFLAGDMDSPGQAAMRKLWGEFRERSYLIEWPTGCKDANDALLKVCGGDTEKFQELVERLKSEALERPMQFMYDLKHSIKRMDKTNPLDDPARLHMPWPAMDRWTAIVPGDIMCLFATESKTGKSTWLMNILLHNAIKYGKVVVNYSAELSPAQYARRVVSHLVRKDRENLTQADFDEAFYRIGEARFYNGYQPKANYKTVIDLLVAAKKRLGADIFVIDHLHFLTRGTKDEAQAVSEAMRLLKDFAFDYNVVVVVVGQPRKMPSNQRAREATAQDAKSSEAFGSDASQVFIMHRDRTSMVEGEPIFSPVTKIKLDYSRESATKFMNLMFEGPICTFYEMENNSSQEIR